MQLARLFAFLLLTLCACNKPTAPVVPHAITEKTYCSLDGMVLSGFPGPKAQIHYTTGSPDFFGDTMEMFSVYLQPEQIKHITGIFTQDIGKTDWGNPKDNWIDAKQAYYVLGSKKTGSMGPTIASFSLLHDAYNFTQQFGGKVLRFEQVTPEMVDLTGGVINDEYM